MTAFAMWTLLRSNGTCCGLLTPGASLYSEIPVVGPLPPGCVDWRAEKGLSSVLGERWLGPIWKELSEELFVSRFHMEEGLRFYTTSLPQNENQTGEEIYYTQTSQDCKCPVEGDLPERVFF